MWLALRFSLQNQLVANLEQFSEIAIKREK